MHFKGMLEKSLNVFQKGAAWLSLEVGEYGTADGAARAFGVLEPRPRI